MDRLKDHRTTTVKEKETNQNISNKNRKVISVNNLTHDSSIKTKLRCLNTNAQSLQFKMDELKQVIKEKKYTNYNYNRKLGTTMERGNIRYRWFYNVQKGQN